MSPLLNDLVVTVSRRARAWAADRRSQLGSQLALVGRFGPMTARAWTAVLQVAVAERLWRVPRRARPDIASHGTSP